MALPPWSDEHETFRETVRRFAEQEIRPHAEEWQAEGAFPDALFHSAGALGLLGVRFDPRWGGSGLDYWYTVLLVEELVRGRDLGSVLGLLVPCEMATAVLHDHGTDALRREGLGPAIAGDRIGALGVSEPGGGSDVASLRTTATPEGDDYVIDGSKTFISNVLRAHFVTLAVRSGGPGPEGVSLVVSPTDAKGFRVGRRLRTIDLHSSDTAELFFEGVRVPRRYLIGEEGRGFGYITSAFQGERLVLSVMMNALCDDVLHEALLYLGERRAFGRALASMQAWRHRMADWMTRLEASRALTYTATERLIAGDPAREETASMAKLFAAEVVRGLVLDCARAFGGYGFMEENYVARCSRALQNWGVGAGTSEVMREIIARGRMPGGRA